LHFLPKYPVLHKSQTEGSTEHPASQFVISLWHVIVDDWVRVPGAKI